MSNLAEAIPKEIERCEELLKQYEQIGTAGVFGATMIKTHIKEGINALASGDVIRIIAAYKALTECE